MMPTCESLRRCFAGPSSDGHDQPAIDMEPAAGRFVDVLQRAGRQARDVAVPRDQHVADAIGVRRKSRCARRCRGSPCMGISALGFTHS